MKEQTLIEMKRKVETLGSIVQMLMMELEHVKTLSFGNNKLLKVMPGYEEAIEKLKQQVKEETNNVEQ